MLRDFIRPRSCANVSEPGASLPPPAMSVSRASSVRRVRSENDVSSQEAAPVSFLPHSAAQSATPPAPRTSHDGPSPPSTPFPAVTRPIRHAQLQLPSPPPPPVQNDEAVAPTVRPAAAFPSIAPFRHDRSLYTRTKEFFGYGRTGSRERRALVGLYWRLCWGLTQIAAIVVLVAIAANTQSPNPEKNTNEFRACDRPLGAWAIVWAVRVVLSCGMHYWGWTRDRSTDARDPESRPAVTLNNFQPPLAHEPGSRSAAAAAAAAQSTAHQSAETPALPRTRLYGRMNTLVSLLTLSWFLTAHILEYTSVDTCRYDAPHLWWLVFAILCIMYLMVLEVLALGMVVFIIAPVLFLIWNIFLICIGRHPLQNGGPIRPAVGKLPRHAVDCIPLVMYIPPPPDAPAEEQVKIPEVAYSYPPSPKPTTQQQQQQPKRHTWFRFLRKSRRSKTKGEGSGEKEGEGGKEGGHEGTEEKTEPASWEDHWDLEGFPSVVLEGNRAACAICLMDFEEPKRVVGATPAAAAGAAPTADTTAAAAAPTITATSPAPEGVTEEDRLRLADAGEGAQPLRLLACGHVFHKTCLDPWLTDVSGRCPVCQRPVEIPEAPKKAKRGRR